VKAGLVVKLKGFGFDVQTAGTVGTPTCTAERAAGMAAQSAVAANRLGTQGEVQVFSCRRDSYGSDFGLVLDQRDRHGCTTAH
jgi:hypothetical protein